MNSPLLRLRAPTALEYFALLVAEDEGLPLLEAAAAIAQDECPGLDVQQVQSEVDALAQRLRRRIPADAAPSHRLRLLLRFFHEELGFAGNVNDFYAPGNSFVHQVLATRRGLPITLAVLLLEIGRQVGLDLRGVGFPGHFLLKLSLPQGDTLLDPLTGDSLTRQALEEALLPFRGEGAGRPPLEQYLRAASPREILVRMLRNLQLIHRSEGDWLRLLAVQQRLLLLLPDDVGELQLRAQVFEALGHWRSAADDLEHCLMLQPGLVNRTELSAQILGLRRRAGPGLH